MTIKQVSPWVNYCSEVKELFRNDPDITVVSDEVGLILSLYVNDNEKAMALMNLMPVEKHWGNVVLNIRIIPANQNSDTRIDLFRKAFKGNTAFSGVVEIPSEMPFSPSYVLFKPEVVQYYNDDLSDANGLKTTLYQELAKDVFENSHEGIFFCTEKIKDGKEGS